MRLYISGLCVVVGGVAGKIFNYNYHIYDVFYYICKTYR